MKFGVIGSGEVGKTLTAGLLNLGHEVTIGTREPQKLSEWAAGAGKGAVVGSFSDAAGFGDIVFLCVKWAGVENALEMAGGEQKLAGKTVVDVTNPIAMGKEGEGPNVGVGFPGSVGARVQELLPKSKVVKAFNYIPVPYMTKPAFSQGAPDFFVCGDDAAAKQQVVSVAISWGWVEIIDLGTIKEAYLLEALAMALIRHAVSTNNWHLAFKLLRK